MMKQRGARMSKMQQEVYIKFLEQNPNFSSNRNSISYDLSAREKDFDRLVDQLNTTPGAIKNKKQWQETLADWRSKLLKRYRYHYSEEVRNSMPYQSVKNLKKFDQFDVRALKALGKWENDHGGARKILNNTKRKGLRRRRRVGDRQDSDSDQDEQDDEDESDDKDFYSMSSPVSEGFNCLNVKTEVDFEDPLVEEIQPQMPVVQSIEAVPRKRRRETEVPETQFEDVQENYEKVLHENTKAMKQHTMAIMGLTDALNSLTSTIRSYMYNK